MDEERIIIESKKKKLLKILIWLVVAVILLVIFFSYIPASGKFVDFLEQSVINEGKGGRMTFFSDMKMRFWVFPSMYFDHESYDFAGAGMLEKSAVVLAVLLFFYFWIGKSKLTVADTHIYGHTTFGHRVDLPITDIMETRTGAFHSVFVSTKSDVAKFWLIKNNKAVCEEIRKLLLEKSEENKEVSDSREIKSDKFGELKRYKELLDIGAITQAEFEEKKNQLLNT